MSIKNTMSRLRHNLDFAFIIFNTILSIVSIYAGVSMLKTDRYDNPFLVVAAVSNFNWFIFTFFTKSSRQEENQEKIIERNVQPNNDRYVKLVEPLVVTITMIIGVIALINISMGIIITLKIFIS